MPITTANGININYQIAGSGEPLVMIMGFSADSKSWMYQVPVFSRKFQVITFDNRGIGESEKPKPPYSTKGMADDTIALMNCLGIKKAHVLGISMGGMIAQEMAINYPERVSKLILAATYACNDDGMNGPSEELNAALDLPIKDFVKKLRGIATSGFLMKNILVPLLNLKLKKLDEFGTDGMKGQLEACKNHDTAKRLKSIQSTTLVIVGTKDRVLKPTSSKLLAQEIPMAHLVEVENGSHLFCMDMKKRFNDEIMSFLQSE